MQEDYSVPMLIFMAVLTALLLFACIRDERGLKRYINAPDRVGAVAAPVGSVTV